MSVRFMFAFAFGIFIGWTYTEEPPRHERRDDAPASAPSDAHGAPAAQASE